MNVSYSMVRRVHSDVSSTALRQHGRYQDRLTLEAQHPLAGKVLSGAANNVSQLEKLLNLSIIIYLIRNMLKKERIKPANEQKQPFYFKAHGTHPWIQAVSIPEPLIEP